MNNTTKIVRLNHIRQEAVARLARSKRGMSLIEIVVVIAIILTLMSVVGYGVIQVFNNAQVDTTKLSMRNVQTQVDTYMVRKRGKVPSSGEGLKAIFGDMDTPRDAWGNEFKYVSPGPNGEKYDLISLGADGKEGGSGNDADLKLSEIKNE